MKKLKAYWAGLSRPARTLLLLLIALVSSLLTYLTLGSPPLTAESGFRRAEMANMIGPSEILGKFYLGELGFGTEKVVVAQSTDYDIIYHHPQQNFRAYPKTTKPAIYLAAARDSGNDMLLHMVLLDRCPEAVTATVSFNYFGRPNSKISATVSREHDGFFYFYLAKEQSTGYDHLKKLYNAFTGINAENRQIVIKLYDKNGQRLSTRAISPTPATE